MDVCGYPSLAARMRSICCPYRNYLTLSDVALSYCAYDMQITTTNMSVVMMRNNALMDSKHMHAQYI